MKDLLKTRPAKALTRPPLFVVVWLMLGYPAYFFAAPSLTVQLDEVTAKVSPTLYGMMIEEINHSGDGGLYAELIQNRAFLDDANTPVHWSLLPGSNAGAIALDHIQPLCQRPRVIDPPSPV